MVSMVVWTRLSRGPTVNRQWPQSLTYFLQRQGGDSDGDRGAGSRGAADLQASLMRFDDAFDDGQSQAAAFFLGGEKGVEDLIQGLGLNAFAIILEADCSPLTVRTGNN